MTISTNNMPVVTSENLPGHDIIEAMDRMIEDARRIGADGIVAMRMQTSAIQNGASEVLCYGTAVRLKPAK